VILKEGINLTSTRPLTRANARVILKNK